MRAEQSAPTGDQRRRVAAISARWPASPGIATGAIPCPGGTGPALPGLSRHQSSSPGHFAPAGWLLCLPRRSASTTCEARTMKSRACGRLLVRRLEKEAAGASGTRFVAVAGRRKAGDGSREQPSSSALNASLPGGRCNVWLQCFWFGPISAGSRDRNSLRIGDVFSLL